MLLPAFLLFAHPLFSQIQHDTLTAIIGYGLGVYAKDTFSFKPEERSTLEAIRQDNSHLQQSIESLKAGNSSQLKKVGVNVEKWLNKGNAVNTYQPLVKAIEETLTNGGDGAAAKDWRKKNVAGLFTAPVNTYLNGSPEPAESEEASAPQTAEPTTGGPTAISKTTGGNNMLSTIALILSALAITGVAYLYFLFSSRLKDQDDSRKRQRADIDQLKATVAQRANPQAAITTPATLPLEEQLKQLEARMAQFEKGPKSANPTAPPPNATAPPRKAVAEPQVPVNPVKKTAEPQVLVNTIKKAAEPEVPINLVKPTAEPEAETKTFFAKRPDLDNGFKQTDCSTSQNGEQVYEIAVKGNTATFMIVNDASSQKYALSNYRYYLEKACVFLNEPMPNCRIDTKELGELEKNGSNWMIQKKAQIEFV